MAKRRATQDDDDAVEELTPPKRARVQENGESSRGQRADNGRTRRRAAHDEEDGDVEMDGEENGTAAVDETQFEAEHSEAIRQSIEKKSKSQGSAADHGIIEYIEMHQFMCHKFLQFTFGPRINFIIGHNGSGKSAVLTALTVALGGKASTTGRGSGLKAFIREGQPGAEVTIHIKNGGEEAFRKEEFGKTIIITRRFSKEGASTWKIMNQDKKVISTKREDLAAICDHMNIQVDNPMNVLTQDSARQFLSASSPGEKYKLFLRGTQLQQLSDEYDTIRTNISLTSKMLEKKQEVLPDLEAAKNEAATKYEEAKVAREQRYKVDQLKRELAWAHVRSKELELEGKMRDVAKIENKIPGGQRHRDEAQAQVNQASEEVAQFEKDHADFGSPDELVAQRNDIGAEIKRNAAEIARLARDIKDMNDSMSSFQKVIVACEENIAKETAKLAAKEAGRQQELEGRLKLAHDTFKAAEEEFRTLQEKHGEQRAETEKMAVTGRRLEGEMGTIRQQMDGLRATMERVRRSQSHPLAAYGEGMPKALDTIKNAQWHGDIPIGPFGLHVKLRDQRWASVVRNRLGNAMFSFLVTDARDRVQLQRILQNARCRANGIIVAQKDMFDFSQGEPPSNFVTFLRVLEINDPFVLRALVNTASIERTLLFETRAEASEVLNTMRGGGVGYTGDGFNVRNFGDGGEQSQPLGRYPQEMELLFQQGNVEDQTRRLEEQFQRADADLKSKTEEVASVRRAHDESNKLIRKLADEMRKAQARAGQAKRRRDDIQAEVNDEAPMEIHGINVAKQEAENERAVIAAQFQAAMEQKTQLDNANTPLIEEQKSLSHKIRGFDSEKRRLMERVTAAVEKRLNAQNALTHYEKKLAEENQKLERAKEDANVCETEFQDWTSKAEEYCERVQTDRKPDVIQRNLDSVQKTLKERERKLGASVEEMAEEVNKAKKAYEMAEKDLKQMAALNKMLRSSINSRLAKWHEFRRHIALRTKHIFQYHLSNRGYYGKVIFNHEEQTLHLKVQTDDTAGTQAKEKDPRSLSGGEKSFATICLLLALWEAIGCPLRCLDEFDVYMDAVNRRIAMKMMIETANASDKQYILITPQDMGNVQIGTSVRVHRMADPERGQGRLAFGS